jgi:tyrosyl-tRNA synthetase
MSTSFTSDEKFDLITRNLQEVLGGDQIKKIIAADERPLRCYWGACDRSSSKSDP